MGLAGIDGDPFNRGQQLRTHFFIIGTNGQLQFCAIGNNVMLRAGME